MPVSYHASLLPTAETCPGSLEVWNGRVGMTQLWRQAFILGIQPPTVASIEGFRVLKTSLTDLYAVDVDGAIEDYNADVRDGVIPSAHRLAFEVTSDLEGRVPAVGETRIHFTIDCAWAVSKNAEGTETRAVVLQHELARHSTGKVDDLDLAFAGIAMAALYDVPRMQLGRCYHSPGKRPVYQWTKVLGEAEIAVYWERIAGIFRRRPDLNMSPLCETCVPRRQCPQWMLPAAHGATPTYRKLTGQEPYGVNEVSEIRRFVKSLREAADAAEGQLRSLKREGMG